MVISFSLIFFIVSYFTFKIKNGHLHLLQSLVRLASRSGGQEVADDKEKLEVLQRRGLLTPTAHILRLKVL